MACCTRKCCCIVQGIIGTLLGLASIVLVVVWPDMYENVFDNTVILTNTSFSYDLWKETPLPMYLELSLYNFTNSQKVFADPEHVKPHFEECGPYVFKEHHIKTNLTWHRNGTVSFLQRRIWHFDETMSKGSLSDNITNINMVAVTAAYFVRHKSKTIRVAVNSVLKLFGEHIVVTKTANQLLFEGYRDKLMDVVNTLNIPGLALPFDKFGWFYGRNESDIYDGWWSIHTGANGVNRLGEMDLWNFKNKTDFYDGDCATVKGSTGELFPPRTNPEMVTVFASDICSYMNLRAVGDVEVEGLKGRLFRGDKLQLENNNCFCKSTDDCAPPGARNVSQCKFGAPAFVSYPHFYLADPSYTDKIDGVIPDPSEDNFEMGLQLDSGIPLFVKAQLQINILVKRIKLISFFDKMPEEVYVPVLRFKQEARITEDLAKQAKLGIEIENIMSIVFYCLIAVGVILVAVAIFVFQKYHLKRSPSQSTLLEQ